MLRTGIKLKSARDRLILAVLATLLLAASPNAAETLRVASYNLENYIVLPGKSRPVKTNESRDKVRESILLAAPHILALQEIGSTNALFELQSSLRAGGLVLPYWEHVTGYDTNIQVAVLSRFPIIDRRPHTEAGFILYGRRFRVLRGFAEVDIRVNDRYELTLITAHLKSKRRVPYADEADLREKEAVVLREIVDRRLETNPDDNLVVLGDFNDTPNTATLKTLIGRGRTKLVDTRPAEQNGDNAPPLTRGYAPRNICWTHYYGLEDTYSRIDYLLISPGLAKEWKQDETVIPTTSNWGVGSDHRPIVATFYTEDR